jgi:hypothetical protein
MIIQVKGLGEFRKVYQLMIHGAGFHGKFVRKVLLGCGMERPWIDLGDVA